MLNGIVHGRCLGIVGAHSVEDFAVVGKRMVVRWTLSMTGWFWSSSSAFCNAVTWDRLLGLFKSQFPQSWTEHNSKIK